MKPFAIALLAVATLFVSAAQARTPERPAVFCKGTYALCIRALCTPDASDSSKVICGCSVEEGWSMGPGNCDSRHPVRDGNGVLTIISTYSNRFNNVEKTLTCANKDTKWAWCYGAPCKVDINDPKSAACKCPVVTGPMRTLGGMCDQDNCSKIWSAATPSNGRFRQQALLPLHEEAPPGLSDQPAGARLS